VIVKLLNYALDYNLPNKLGVGLRILADSYFILNQYSEALYYYNQARYCFLLIDNAQDMIKNMVKMSNCCCRSGLEKESIKILKKALEYSWVYGLTNCEIELYDEIGKSYYLRG
jgi:tetratricopeptide (TPR) repeat protein